MLYKEWVDFIIFPSDSYKVENREDRLKTANALSQDERFENPDLAKKVGYVVSWNDYEFKEDIFEAMWIGDIGDVIIWTDKKVWTLSVRLDGKQRMTYLPRHPDLNLLF